mgnify:CR=1 FL=1
MLFRSDPSLFVRGHDAGYSVLVAHEDTPAACWNQAFACSQTDALVFLHMGAAPSGECVAHLAAAALADAVALATPAILGPTSRTLGLVDRGQLSLAPNPSEERRLVQTVEFGSPIAFAMARAAYHAVGTFDEAIRTGMALVDWTLRSRAHGLRCVGSSSATASIHPAIPSKELDRCDADHWLLLARHRPEHLAVAVLKSPSVFRMPAEQLATTLRDVFLRLPQAAEFPAAAQMLAQQALAMTAPLASHPKVVAEVHALANLLSLEVLAEQDAAELAHAVREAVEAQCEEIACLEREARQVPALQAQLATALQAVRESQQQMLAGVETTRIAEHARAERDEIGRAHV